MAEEQDPETPSTETPPTEAPPAETEAEAGDRVRAAAQAPLHLPPKLRDAFGKVEGAFADRPGFRNSANTGSKAQRKKRKKR